MLYKVPTATGLFYSSHYFYHALSNLVVKYLIVYNLRHGKYRFIVIFSIKVPNEGYSRNAFSFLYTMYYVQKRSYSHIFFIFFTLISLLIWLKQYFLKLLSVLVLAMSLDTFRFQVAYCINIQFFCTYYE